ncbi:PAS domain-containing protein [Shewanella corallii]|uniref:PAS domain-containing protein n=1 Tax=Shewanella corallii TaxID=560080 RepID=A0ABT0N9I8_9GAMM|nr:PAS domain-containing protein [Shewanella corallii]MCL2914770.1 PAS domain-containing protein [Shewanella corallii]
MTAHHNSENPTGIRQWLRSLPVKISLIQLAIALALILLTWWIMLGIQKQQLMTQELTVNRHLGQLVVTRLHEATAQVNSLVASLSSLGELESGSTAKLRKVVPALLDLESQKQLIAGGGIWPEQTESSTGESAFWARTESGELTEVKGYSGQNYRHEFWYEPTRLLPRGKTLWSKAYQDPVTRETMVTASSAMWFDHSYLGAATVDISLEHLNQFIDAGRTDIPGYVLVVDPYRQIIAAPGSLTSKQLPLTFSELQSTHPEMEQLAKRLIEADQQQKLKGAYRFNAQHSAAEHIPGLNDDDAKRTQTLLANLTQGWPGSPLELTSFTLAKDPLLNERVMVSVFLMPDTLWHVIIATPLDALGKEAQGIAGKVGLLLVVIQVLALFMLFWVLHRMLVSPLSRMAQALYQDRPEQLEIEASQRNDELGKLAAAFVSRHQQLETALASLEANHLALEQQLAVQQESKLELGRYRDLLQALMESSPNMIFVKDLKGVYQMVNPRYCQVVAREQRQIVGHTDEEIYPVLDAKRFHTNDQKVLQSSEPITFDEILSDHRGDRYFKVTKFAIRNEEDEVLAIGGIGHEVVPKGTERIG